VSKSVLLLDENPEVLAFLTRLFEGRDLRVLRARSKSEAFEVLGKTYVPVDLILANLMVTQLDESDFDREVASVRRGISVIYMSAFVDSEVIRVEAVSRFNNPGFSAVDERGVLEAVLSALGNSGARAIGR
jgi:CheY-like chemotaxis protein